MNKQHGFSMVEVLVAVVVLVFGVLGMVGLQMQAITATEQARYSSRAAMQATSIAAAIKANPGYWYTFSGAVTVVDTTLTGGPSSFSGSCISGTICTPVQMAAYDLQYWGHDVYGSLPSSKFTVTCDRTPSPPVCTVEVSWYEKNVIGRNQAGGSGDLASGGATLRKYQTLVSPITRMVTS